MSNFLLFPLPASLLCLPGAIPPIHYLIEETPVLCARAQAGQCVLQVSSGARLFPLPVPMNGRTSSRGLVADLVTDLIRRLLYLAAHHPWVIQRKVRTIPSLTSLGMTKKRAFLSLIQPQFPDRLSAGMHATVTQ